MCFATTNGTLVHDEVQEWGARNKDRFLLGLSLDGTPDMHNENRGKSYSRIDIDFFRRTWPLQPVKMTVSRRTLPSLADGLIHIHGLGLKAICTYAFGVEWQQEDCDIFARELRKIADYYLDHPESEPSNIVSMAVEHTGGGERHSNYCGTGKNIYCIDRNGERFPCQTFLPMSTGRTAEEMMPAFEKRKRGGADTLRNAGKMRSPVVLGRGRQDAGRGVGV